MSTARILKTVVPTMAISMLCLAGPAMAGDSSIRFILGLANHSYGGGHVCSSGHYETVLTRVQVEEGYYQTVYRPEQRVEYYDEYGRRHIVITPARYERVWVAPRYREVAQRVWVPGCGCGNTSYGYDNHSRRQVPATRQSRSRRDDGLTLHYSKTSKHGSYGFSIRF